MIFLAVVESLKHLLDDADDIVRMKATEVLYIMSGKHDI